MPWVPRFDVREWQTAGLSAWRRTQQGIVRVVTGAGKTRFAELRILDVRRSQADVRVAILVPSIALADQWCVSLQEDLDLTDADVAVFYGASSFAHVAAVNVYVLNTGRTLLRRHMESKPGPWMLIVDECHRAASPENARALRGTFTATLGLSATPEREDDGHTRVLIPVLGPVVYEYTYEDASRDHVIVPFVLVNVRVPMSGDEERRYSALTRRIGRLWATDADADAIKLTLLRRARLVSSIRMRVPTAVALALKERSARTLIFHERIAEATEISTLIGRRGRMVAEYHTRIGPALRRENLRLFRRGVYDVLVTCRALDEGTNVPETSVGIIASSTASSRQRIQRLGRVLRPARGKHSSTVYTIYSTDAEEDRLRTESATLATVASVRWMKGGA